MTGGDIVVEGGVHSTGEYGAPPSYRMDPLYKLLHTFVRTPKGAGYLVQVFDDRVTVILGRGQQAVAEFFRPDQIAKYKRLPKNLPDPQSWQRKRHPTDVH